MNKPNKLQKLFDELKAIQDEFLTKFNRPDIISNSKIFEVIIANYLNHQLLPGYAGSRDAKDEEDREYEYKHYKETSSNHTWTFNDFSDATIEKLKKIEAVIFAHINDNKKQPVFDWYYYVPGKTISAYLRIATRKIKNKRKMINVSRKQIETKMGIQRLEVDTKMSTNQYKYWIDKTFKIAQKIEEIVKTKNILTSNKFWELLIALQMKHKVLSEQKAFDAVDAQGNFYEYKAAQKESWAFEDITKKVLEIYCH